MEKNTVNHEKNSTKTRHLVQKLVTEKSVTEKQDGSPQHTSPRSNSAERSNPTRKKQPNHSPTRQTRGKARLKPADAASHMGAPLLSKRAASVQEKFGKACSNSNATTSNEPDQSSEPALRKLQKPDNGAYSLETLKNQSVHSLALSQRGLMSPSATEKQPNAIAGDLVECSAPAVLEESDDTQQAQNPHRVVQDHHDPISAPAASLSLAPFLCDRSSATLNPSRSSSNFGRLFTSACEKKEELWKQPSKILSDTDTATNICPPQPHTSHTSASTTISSSGCSNTINQGTPYAEQAPAHSQNQPPLQIYSASASSQHYAQTLQGPCSGVQVLQLKIRKAYPNLNNQPSPQLQALNGKHVKNKLQSDQAAARGRVSVSSSVHKGSQAVGHKKWPLFELEPSSLPNPKKNSLFFL